MCLLDETIADIGSKDAETEAACAAHWDSLCKPLGGLGMLEDIVTQIGGIQKTELVHLARRAVVIMGADNGVVEEGVSQTGSEVTAQVLYNMGEGLSTVCVMSKGLNCKVFPVDIGMNKPAGHPAVRDAAVRRGTGNIAKGPAMSREECIRAIETGISIAEELAEKGYDLIITGEMGIGNTTTSAACACALFGLSPDMAVGRGAGLSAEGLKRKRSAVRRALEVNCPDKSDPISVISKVGGLDIAGMTGLFLGGAKRRIPVLIDGVISGISACMAKMLCPSCSDFMIATHSPSEPAGEYVMRFLGKTPFLYAGMHLGEGTGAAAGLAVIDQAVNVYYGLPTFDEGCVKQYEHLI